MEKKLTIEVTIGHKEVAHNGVETYFGAYTDNGMCYKNLQAFENGLGVIYIGECELQDENLESTNSTLWTRSSWIEYVKEKCNKELGSERIHEISDECDYADFIETCALSILSDCDWQDLSTLLEEHLQYSDWFEEMLKSYFNKEVY